MGFNLKTWVNRISEYPTRRKLTKSDGSTELVTVERAEGQVSQEGNAFSADEMNDLEKRISEGFDELNSDIGSLQVYYQATEASSVPDFINKKIQIMTSKSKNGLYIDRGVYAGSYYAITIGNVVGDVIIGTAVIGDVFYHWWKPSTASEVNVFALAKQTDLNALKKSCSDGKTLVANAITAKGVATAADATFAVMAKNIGSIKTSGSYHTFTIGSIAGHDTYTVNLANYVTSDIYQQLSLYNFSFIPATINMYNNTGTPNQNITNGIGMSYDQTSGILTIKVGYSNGYNLSGYMGGIVYCTYYN